MTAVPGTPGVPALGKTDLGFLKDHPLFALLGVPVEIQDKEPAAIVLDRV